MKYLAVLRFRDKSGHEWIENLMLDEDTATIRLAEFLTSSAEINEDYREVVNIHAIVDNAKTSSIISQAKILAEQMSKYDSDYEYTVTQKNNHRDSFD